MSKILITGNGFDLYHGLPTKYIHFMAIMMTIEDRNFDKDVIFDELFGKIFKVKYGRDYDLILEKFNIENIVYEHKIIEEIRLLLKGNSWYQYFKSALELKTWIDFENEIESVLNLTYDVINFANKKRILPKIIYKLDNETAYLNYRIKEFNILLFNEEDIFTFYVDEKNINSREKKIDTDKILDELVESLEQFTSIFKFYLDLIVRSLSTNIKKKYSFPFDSIDLIFTFNYTQIIEDVYNFDKLKIVYLHGNLVSNNLVLGISEVNKIIKENKSYGFTKNYQRIIKKTNNKFISYANEDNLEEFVFYIIGHSLDISDKNYILRLFNFLESDKQELSKIYIFYYNEQDHKTKLNNLFNIVDNDLLVDLNQNKRLLFFELNEENIKQNFQKTIL